MALDHKLTNSTAENNVKNLESILRQNSNFGDGVVVEEYYVQQLIRFGDNYASRILQVNAKVKRDEQSPTKDFYFVAKKIMEPVPYWTRLLKREIFMYIDIISLYEEIEKDIGIEDKECIAHIFPKSYGHRLALDPKKDIDEEALILLENLKPQGFNVEDKKLGLDLKHAIVAIQHLAKFHAVGIAAKNQYPIRFEKIKTEAMKPGFDRSESFVRAIVNIIRKAPCAAKHMERIEELAVMPIEEVTKQLIRNDVWTTIIHHDFWTNNIMFRHDESENINGVKIIDFQSFSYAHIFADFPYFLCSSLKQEVMLNNFDELIDIYYKMFIQTLKNMGLNTTQFGWKEFNKQLREDAALEFLHCVIALLYFTCDVASFDEQQRENINQAILDSGGNDLFFEKLRYLFDIYERKKWLYKDEKRR